MLHRLAAKIIDTISIKFFFNEQALIFSEVRQTTSLFIRYHLYNCTSYCSLTKSVLQILNWQTEGGAGPQGATSQDRLQIQYLGEFEATFETVLGQESGYFDVKKIYVRNLVTLSLYVLYKLGDCLKKLYINFIY